MHKKKFPLGKLAIYAALLIGAAVFLIPFLWMFIISIKPEGEVFGRALLPSSPTLASYQKLFETTNIVPWYVNSVEISVITTILATILSIMGGYAFAKYQFRGKNVLFIIILASMMVPQFTTIIPVFNLMNKLGLVNSKLSLILPFSVNATTVFLARQYLMGIPNELIDQARIDGCNELQIFLRIIMPLSKPLVGSSAILIFLNTWNQYLWPLVMMQANEKFMLTVGLASLTTLYNIEYSLLSAGAVLFTLPVVIVFLLMQRQFVSGLTAGAVKF